MIFQWNSSFSSSFARVKLENFRRFKWSSGFSSWVNLILKARRPRSFHIIRHSVVWAMPNSWERRGIDWFGSFWMDALTAAIISSLRAIRRLFGTGTSNSVNLVSNYVNVSVNENGKKICPWMYNYNLPGLKVWNRNFPIYGACHQFRDRTTASAASSSPSTSWERFSVDKNPSSI